MENNLIALNQIQQMTKKNVSDCKIVKQYITM